MLPASASFTADAEAQVGGGERLVDHGDLRGEHLLQADDVRVGLAEEPGEHRGPLGPVVGLTGEGALVVVPDVLGEEREGGRLRVGGCHRSILAHDGRGPTRQGVSRRGSAPAMLRP